MRHANHETKCRNEDRMERNAQCDTRREFQCTGGRNGSKKNIRGRRGRASIEEKKATKYKTVNKERKELVRMIEESG